VARALIPAVVLLAGMVTREATEALARRDLAGRLTASESEIEVVASAERTWPDQTLGCGAARKGMTEPRPTPGFALTLSHGGKTYEYHADRRGHVVRCDAPAKPRGPITR
jgi:hypothetical protein